MNRRTTGTAWLAVGLILLTGATVAIIPLADCPECNPIDPTVPGFLIAGAVPAVCPLCGGRGKQPFWRAWTYGPPRAYPHFLR